MAYQRRRQQFKNKVSEEISKEVSSQIEEPKIQKSNVVFLNDEDRRLLKKYNKHIINKLGLKATRSIKL